MSDDRVETHVTVDEPDAGRRAIHFQEWWVRYGAALPAEAIVPVGAKEAKPAPGVLEAIAAADVVVLPPSNPIVSVGRDPRRARHPRGDPVRRRLPWSGVSPIIGGAPVRGMADPCLRSAGIEVSAEAVGRHYGARSRGADASGLLDAWLVDTADAGARIDGMRVVAMPLLMPTPAEAASAGRRCPGGRPCCRLSPYPDSRRSPPGTTSQHSIAAAAPELRDGDVVVVTSKIVSKAEGRIVPAGDDREATRLAAVDAEMVRVVAARGRTRIVETRSGLVMANAGVDTSNIDKDTIALLPADPDASARRIREGLRARSRRRCRGSGHGYVRPAVAAGAHRRRDRRGRAWRRCARTSVRSTATATSSA